MKQIIALVFIVALVNARSYTSYKQCDASWKSDQLGTSSSTICSAGCLITSVAMMLNTYGVKVDGNVANPHYMNIWLKSHGGYASGNLFVWGSINTLGFTYQGKVTSSAAKTNFDSGKHVILCVKNGGHYVLMTSYSGSTFNVNDPGSSTTSTYAESGVTNAAVYTRASMEYFKNHILNLE